MVQTESWGCCIVILFILFGLFLTAGARRPVTYFGEPICPNTSSKDKYPAQAN